MSSISQSRNVFKVAAPGTDRCHVTAHNDLGYRWQPGGSITASMSKVVKKETKTYTKRSPDEPGMELVTTETTETMDDGSTVKTVKTTKQPAGALNTFHKETKKALEESKHGYRHRSSSSSSSEGGKKKHHHHKHRSRSPSPEKDKKNGGGGFLAKLRRKSRSPSPKHNEKHKKESKTRHRSDSGSSSSSDDSDFEEECIKAHNECRKKHNAPPLKRNKELSSQAKEWAKKLAKNDMMSHNKESSYGENIYCKWSSNPKHKVKGSEAVDSWYAEIAEHEFYKEPSPGVLKSGHFSQVVWLSSKHIGVGKARSKSGRVYVVANYDPAGNFLGDYTDNVPPTGGFPPGHKPKREETRVEKKKSKHRGRSSSSSSSSDEEDFAEECLKVHNEYRRKHGVPPLQLDKKLCKYSKEWARKIAAQDLMEHRSDKKYGENIFCVWSNDPSFRVGGKEAVDSWYGEIKDHNFGKEPEAGIMKSGHFSQVIWKKSKKMGVGKARSKSGKVMVVANYEPAGNFIGEFTENVPRPK